MTTPSRALPRSTLVLRMESFTPGVSDVRTEADRGHDHPESALPQCTCGDRLAMPGIRFEKHVVYAGDIGVVHHAQLTFGNGTIMPGSVDNTNE
jgi:hypothetical protein